ncbi:hypothetical protein QBC44DRAFT_75526 [Cladorrhinum sp. PSN332]|nr:hypothetical protein QBC44DRAFT_75526 [Cladorrhinum sp. PSN332]
MMHKELHYFVRTGCLASDRTGWGRTWGLLTEKVAADFREEAFWGTHRSGCKYNGGWSFNNNNNNNNNNNTRHAVHQVSYDDRPLISIAPDSQILRNQTFHIRFTSILVFISYFLRFLSFLLVCFAFFGFLAFWGLRTRFALISQPPLLYPRHLLLQFRRSLFLHTTILTSLVTSFSSCSRFSFFFIFPPYFFYLFPPERNRIVHIWLSEPTLLSEE